MELAQVCQGDCQREHGEDEHGGHGNTRVGPQRLASGQRLYRHAGPVGSAQERRGQRISDREGKEVTRSPGEHEQLEPGQQNQHRRGEQEPAHSGYQRPQDNGRAGPGRSAWALNSVQLVGFGVLDSVVIHRGHLPAACGTAIPSR